MEFVSIVCPVCRAVRDVEQLEPDTYYCPYHKGRFEWIDVNQITVRHVSYYCACGNQVESHCQLCGNSLCGECDALEAQRRLVNQNDGTIQGRNAEAQTYGRLIVPVRGSGYLEYVHLSKVWTIAGTRVRIVAPASPVIGPFWCVSEIFPQLGAEGLQNVCCECVGARVQDTAEAIAAGRLCEHPGCPATPTERCRCCGNAFCSRHFHDNISPRRRETSLRFESRTFPAPSQVGLCAMCGDECLLEAREAIEALLAASLFGASRKVRNLIDGFDHGARPCRRDWFFDQDVASCENFPGRPRRTWVSQRKRDFMISTYRRLRD